MRTVHVPQDWETGGAYDPDAPLSTALGEFVSAALAFRDQGETQIARADHAHRQALADWMALDGRPERPELPVTPGRRLPYDAPPVKQAPYLLALGRLQRTHALADTTPRMLLLALVAAYDSFVGNLLRATYKLQPRLLQQTNRSLAWPEVSLLPDIGAVMGLVIEREVDSLLHQGRQEQLQTLARLVGTKSLDEFDERSAFVEIAERRNLFAHTGGRVTAHYLSQRRARDPEDSGPGEFLSSDADYLRHASEVLLVVAVLLTQTIWRKIGGKDQLGAADRDLSQLCYVLLIHEEWALAQRLLRFATGLPAHSSEQHRLVLKVNYAQTFKWQGNQRSCDEVLAAEEWEAKDLPFRLAHAVLVDEHDEAARLMVAGSRDQQIRRSAFEHWPLYREFRRTPQFRAAYREAFGEEAPLPIPGPRGQAWTPASDVRGATA